MLKKIILAVIILAVSVGIIDVLITFGSVQR